VTPPTGDSSASATPWPPRLPTRPNVTAVTQTAVASATLPTAMRRRRPRGW
jgi:hypothetical protein